ncbi:unnamed protein product, partial [Brassica oleracea var. botrytis]
IPYDKPFIVIVGAGKRNTRVEWGDHDSVAQSPTFATVADNTVVKSLTFVNTYNFPNKGKVNRNPRIPTVAALINGDKCAFYSVGFSGVQDTLWDADGRHFFHLCAVDFIFGNGQSIYKKCVINVLGATLKPGVAGYITAQGRTNPYDASGFVFTDNLVHGTGKAFLGRPWRSYARLTFAEIGYYGSGSNTGRRVSWVKKLSGFSVQSMINLDFITSGGWVQALPISV